MDVKKIAYELSGPFAKVGAPKADKDISNLFQNFQKNVFVAKSFDSNIRYSYRSLFH